VGLGSGEPSAASPAPPQISLFVVVAAVVGGCAAGAVGTVAILPDRATTTAAKILAVTIPGLLVLLVPAVVIANRFTR
jgi:hypothetical protein